MAPPKKKIYLSKNLRKNKTNGTDECSVKKPATNSDSCIFILLVRKMEN
jgi:hypothetical protein